MKTKKINIQISTVIICLSFLTAVFCYASALCTHQCDGVVGPHGFHNESKATLNHTRIIVNGKCTDIRVGSSSDKSACFCNDNSAEPSDC